MKKTLALVACLLLSVFFVNAQNNVIDDELQKILNQKGNDYIDVNIMLKAQMTSDDFAVLNCKSDSKEVRREIVTNELKKFAEKSQRDIMSVIKAEERSNSVIDIKTHWIANFINCKAKRDVIYQLASHPDVVLITYNSEMDTEFMLSNEETRGTQAATGNIAQHVTQIKADKVWDLGYTGKGVVVAVLDSGSNLNHADIKDHLWNENGKYGYNVHSTNSTPSDEGSNGHGTHCAGIVCGDGTSGQKTGIAPDATLMTIKIIGGGRCTAQNLVDGVEKAAELGADIISLSVGRENPDENRALFRQTFTNLLKSNIAAAVACGNDGITTISVPHNVRTPGDCPPPWIHPDQQGNANNNLTSVISVGAVNENNVVSPSSSKGPVTWQDIAGYNDYAYNPGIGLIRPDIAAPGENVYSLNVNNDNGYWGKSGTSQAAPCVAGVMALMLEKNPDLTPADLCRIIETTASNKPATKNNSIGSGVIDALAAVQAVNFNEAIVINPYDYTRTLNAGSNLNLELTLINNGSGSTSGNTTVTISENDNYTTIVTGSKSYSTMASGKTASATFVVSVDALAPDNHEVTFTVNAGTRTFDIVVTISNEFVAPSLTATANGTNVNLTWNATNNATSYNVYRNGAFLTNTKSTSYTDSGLEFGTVYAYTVTSKRGDLESEHSLITRAQTEDNPDRPSPTNVKVNNERITWTNGTGSKDSKIYRKDVNTSVETNIATNVKGSYYTDNNWNSLEDGVYQYGVANTYAVNEKIYEESFEGANNWTFYNEGWNYGATNWRIDSQSNLGGKTFTPVDGSKSAFFSNTVKNQNYLSYLVSPQFDLTEQSGNVKLYFYYITPTWSGDINTLEVMVSATNNGGWTQLWTNNKADATEWTKAEVDLSAYVGQQFYISFLNRAGAGYCTGVDNISIAVEGSSESRIEWSENIYKNYNIFVNDGLWSNTNNWAARRLPNANDSQVIIDANATIASGNITVNSLTINEGKTLTLNNGATLTVNGDFSNTDVDAFIINDGAQVFQNNDDVSATFVMNISNPDEWTNKNKDGWQFIASPVKDANIEDFVPSSSRYDLYKYDGNKGKEWLNHKDGNDDDEEEPEVPEEPIIEEITIGSGSTTSVIPPTQTNYNYSISQQIYLADDLQGHTGKITSYAFKPSKEIYYNGNIYTITRNFSIYVMNTDKTEFGSTTDWINVKSNDLVFSGNVTYSSKDEWTTVEFDTPFEYENGKNIIVCICDATGLFSPEAMSYYTMTTTSYRSLFKYNDGSSYNPFDATSIPGIRNSYVAQAKLTFQSEGNVTPIIPAPSAPKNLMANVTGPTTIDLSWDSVDGVTSYNVYQGTAQIATNITSTSYNIEGLTANTEYCYTVTAVNEGGESEKSAEVCATTEEEPVIEEIIVEIGKDTKLSGYYYPLAGAMHTKYSISQQIYLQNEIGTTGIIKQIQFKNQRGCGDVRDIHVYMQNTDATEFTNGWINITSEPVYSGKIDSGSNDGDWITIDLTKEFEYTGNNLLVCVYDATGEPSSNYSKSNKFYVYETTNRALGANSMSSTYDPTSLTYISANKINNNQIKLTIEPTSAKSSTSSQKTVNLNGGFDMVDSFSYSGTELSNFETTFQQGVGYLASYESETTATFKGTLNHENSYTFNVSYNSDKDLANFHLLGNPFSFDMNWGKVSTSNMINGYAVVNNEGGYNYATSGEIKVGDGFFVKATSANPSIYYNTRSRNDKKETSLNVIATSKGGKDNVIVRLDEEQEGFPKIENLNKDIALVYVLDNEVPYGIYNYSEDVQEVELFFKVAHIGEYNIHIEPNGEFEYITLVDKANGSETNMMTSSYSFTATLKENGNRFSLKFATGKGADGQENFVYQSGSELIINGEGHLQIIDLMGRMVYSDEVTDDNSRIDMSSFNKGAYIIRMINEECVKTQKITVY